MTGAIDVHKIRKVTAEGRIITISMNDGSNDIKLLHPSIEQQRASYNMNRMDPTTRRYLVGRCDQQSDGCISIPLTPTLPARRLARVATGAAARLASARAEQR